jgi:XTP/dITP diphosphohydrolase
MKLKLIFATNNENKLLEIQKMVPENVELLSLKSFGLYDDLEETGDNLVDNALQKVRFVYEKTGMNCFADDTGLEISALNNEPGVYSSRYAGDERNSQKNMELVLEKMRNYQDREARFRTVIALIFEKNEYLFEGIIDGSITLEPKGIKGFGYDPIFVPEMHEKTFAELDLIKKNKISHRARAFAKLIDFLRSHS